MAAADLFFAVTDAIRASDVVAIPLGAVELAAAITV
jgi:hypothetical protein